MTNAELLAKIKAEIERRLDKHWEGLPNADAPEDNWTHNELCELGAYKELEHLETFLSTLESEKPINPEAAMKELDEKIALVKRRGTWDGVDVDKYMDEVRGREPEKPIDLVEEVKRYYSDNFEYISSDQPTLSILTNVARHFAQWQKEQMISALKNGGELPIEFYDKLHEVDQAAFQNGKKSMKEQMMKEAVEGMVEYDYSTGDTDYLRVLAEISSNQFDVKDGDKVRVIVLPKEY